MAEVRILASGFGFAEGPVVTPDGSVVLTDIKEGCVWRVAPDGTKSLLARTGGGPNGLAIGPDGALYCCNNGGGLYRPDHFMAVGPAPDYAGGSIQRIDPRSGQVRTLYTECSGHRLSAPNDLAFDSAGGFWFTDLGKRYARTRDHGGLYYALPDGSRIVEVAYPILSPNGVGLSQDGKIVYVADTEPARLWAFDVEAAGVVRKHPFPSPHGGRLVAGLPGYQRFDSLAVQADGAICVATLVTGCITVIAPDGRVVRQAKMPDTHPTNICFGGPDLRTAYVSLSETGRLGAVEWPDAGLRLNF
ncbi:MAG TPA: SMP-30/gluconolactonase/LRE family protein [Acetobacteraceae bacterium]|nr:SMP-30/gluconolactonase/LRE family protein [Acetobacteraceae bacterium]